MDIDGAARHRVTSFHSLLHRAAVVLTYVPDRIVSTETQAHGLDLMSFLRGTTCVVCNPLLVLPKCSLPLASAFVEWSSLVRWFIGLRGWWKILWGVEWRATRKTRFDFLSPTKSTTVQCLDKLSLQLTVS